jgi:hypothetical protein
VGILYSGLIVSNYHHVEADLTDFDKGVYFIRVVSNKELIISDKLIVN